VNSHLQNINHENAIPSVSQKYSNEPISLKDQQILLDEELNLADISLDCVKEIRDVIGNNKSIWKRIFHKNTKETIFNNSNRCSFQVLITILQDKYKRPITVQNIKTSLWNAYSEYMTKYGDKIIMILKKQGKRSIADSIIKQKLSLEDVINSESYYLTDLDVWIFAKKFDLPILLFSSTSLKNLFDSEIDWLLFGGKYTTDKYYFIRSQSNVPTNTVPVYNLITPSVELHSLPEFYTILEETISKNATVPQSNIQSLNHYLESYIYIIKKAK
jgi:hypothetical protein